MELDPIASDIVLRSIKEAVPSTWPAKIAELRRIAQGRESVTLAHYLEESGSDLDDVYTNGRSWSDLRAAAGLPQQAPGPEEQNLRRACGRLLHIDDMERIEGYRRLLAAPQRDQPSPSLRGPLRWYRAEAISRRPGLRGLETRATHDLGDLQTGDPVKSSVVIGQEEIALRLDSARRLYRIRRLEIVLRANHRRTAQHLEGDWNQVPGRLTQEGRERVDESEVLFSQRPDMAFEFGEHRSPELSA